ncbi:MAG: polysaccharide pyruvyl transferase family protein [Opitutales bacterium]
MRKPSVEILGPWIPNKGDALMLHALARQLGDRYNLCVRSALGLDQLPADPPLYRVIEETGWSALRRGLMQGSLEARARTTRRTLALHFAPRSWLEKRRIADHRRLRALLDCSGFAYGDQWSNRRIQSRTQLYRKLRRQGTKLILLPQALGPFDKPEIAGPAREMLGLFERVYARDAQSRAHLLDLGIPAERVGQAPDVTHLLEGRPLADAELWRKRVAIVPNARMTDRTDPAVAARYVAYLAHCIARVEHAGFEPWILQHEVNDDRIIGQLIEAVGHPLSVADEDALTTKAILGACHAAIASRFHSLVSCLSQGTPAIGTSWSHKYNGLFAEYGFEQFLLSPLDEISTVDARVDDLLQAESHRSLRAQLEMHAASRKAEVEAMWRDVIARIDGVTQEPAAPGSRA